MTKILIDNNVEYTEIESIFSCRPYSTEQNNKKNEYLLVSYCDDDKISIDYKEAKEINTRKFIDKLLSY